MQIWVALANNQLTSLDHSEVTLSSASPLQFGTVEAEAAELGVSRVTVRAVGTGLQMVGLEGRGHHDSAKFYFRAPSITVSSLTRGKNSPSYVGLLRLENFGGKLRLSLRLSLDQYLRGVLEAEMPASYHPEALKCQALAARTYALKPRISHEKDHANVCDSYLCCQYFAGSPRALDPRIEAAVSNTASQVLTYGDEPILALFSSNAGGHTENYENCFSDPLTGQFPPAPLPYLRGVSECRGEKPFAYQGAALIKHLYESARRGENPTLDSWTPKFHWRVEIDADSLEAHMHNVVKKLTVGDTAPFVIPPPGARFGHIEKLEVIKRGVSGVAVEMAIRTSHGDWLLKKELTIRKAFANPEANLARLNSARILIDHHYEGAKPNLLKSISIAGLGFGHGVGLQQTGAQGFARAGFSYREILAHYFPGTAIAVL